jgi:hydrogenase expression/formation protein HypD
MVYAVTDALKIARDNPGKEVVFFAIGFETTTPPTAWPSSRPRRKA